MIPQEQAELLRLYKKTGGGRVWLSDADFSAYAALRKKNYTDRKAELLAEKMLDGITPKYISVKAVKDDTGDIIGWQFS